MKKIILSWALALFMYATNAQNTFPSSGNVGIGTASPSALLSVGSSSQFKVNSSGAIASATGIVSSGTLQMTGSGSGFSNNFSLTGTGANTFNIYPFSDGNTYLQHNGTVVFSAVGQTAGQLTIANNGNIGIGTFDTKGYKFAVDGAAIATSMKVKLSGNWPDFVFKKDYKLPTLAEVKSYIDENQHLPEMPSAEEVHAKGLDLGEMNRLLLKKVEELTLYLIEKDEQINLLKADQQKQIDQLKAQLSRLGANK